MRLKERIDELEMRLESIEMAVRMIAAYTGAGAMVSGEDFEKDFVADSQSRAAEANGGPLAPEDAEAVTQDAYAVLEELKYLLAAGEHALPTDEKAAG